jgi:hypothetical protein
MGKRGGKGKRKENSSFLGWGHDFWPTPGASARESAYGPAAAQERGGGRRCARVVTASLWPHLPARVGGGTAPRPDGVANRSSEGEGPVAGELDGGLPPMARFSVQGMVV